MIILLIDSDKKLSKKHRLNGLIKNDHIYNLTPLAYNSQGYKIKSNKQGAK